MRSVVSDSRRDNQCHKRCQWVEHCKSGEPMDNKKRRKRFEQQSHCYCVRQRMCSTEIACNEITRHTMILPNDNALRVHFSIAEKMTTVKPDGACNVFNDTRQVRQQKNNNNDEIQHGNATPQLHLGALYTTVYDKCCGR